MQRPNCEREKSENTFGLSRIFVEFRLYFVKLFYKFVLGQTKKSPVSNYRSASKSVRWRVFFNFFLTQWLEPDQISHTQSMVAKRGLTNWANVHTPMWKSRLKHSAAEIQSIQQFWLQLGIVS